MLEDGMPPKWYPVGEPAQHYAGRAQGHAEMLSLLRVEADALRDKAFRMRTLNQNAEARATEEQAELLLSLVASLPTKLRAIDGTR